MSRKKNLVYVGGLEDSVTEELLFAAFIPFGEIKSVQIMKDYVHNKSRGFGFVEFDLVEDAVDAIENMDGAELLGRVLRCNVAKLPSAKVEPGKSVWDSEEFLKTVAGQNNSEDDIALEGMEPVR